MLGLHPSTVYRVPSRYGIPADLARRTADVMVETDLCGVDSHGIAMLPWYAALLRTGEVHATARSHVLRETAVSAVVDAALDQIRSHADGGLTPSAGPRRWQNHKGYELAVHRRRENRVDVGLTAWWLTIGGIGLIFAFDFLVMGRRPHVVSIREAAVSVAAYVAVAVLFGIGIWVLAGGQYGMEFFAGYITELSLSVDNLFVFVVVMSAFAVPRENQLRVLQLGIIGALVLRFIFILVGAAALARFAWLFFVFGAFLLWTAYKLATEHGTEVEPGDNKVLKYVERVLPTTQDYHGGRFTVQIQGKRVFTPLAVVMVAIFLTDIMFAMDSIPAIFGLTRETYIVFTANAFALMGLRQMFFLLDGLLDRLIYLSLGLAVILGFVGIKLILHAMHEYHIGELPEITTVTSLLVIVLTLTVTVLASLAKVRRNPEVLATHDVTGHHHPQGEELEELRATGRHPQPEPAEPLRPEDAPAEGDPDRRSGPRDKQ